MPILQGGNALGETAACAAELATSYRETILESRSIPPKNAIGVPLLAARVGFSPLRGGEFR
jgi:hypothetical protein